MALSPPSAGLGTPPPMAFQGSQERKFPQAPGQAQALHKQQLRPGTAPSLMAAWGRVPSPAAARYLLPRPGSWVLEGSPDRFLLVHAASLWPYFLHLEALWINHVTHPRVSRNPRTDAFTAKKQGRLSSSTLLSFQLTPPRIRGHPILKDTFGPVCNHWPSFFPKRPYQTTCLSVPALNPGTSSHSYASVLPRLSTSPASAMSPPSTLSPTTRRSCWLNPPESTPYLELQLLPLVPSTSLPPLLMAKWPYFFSGAPGYLSPCLCCGKVLHHLHPLPGLICPLPFLKMCLGIPHRVLT